MLGEPIPRGQEDGFEFTEILCLLQVAQHSPVFWPLQKGAFYGTAM